MENDQVIQRTIEDESSIQVNESVPVSEAQTNHMVFFGIAAILLLIIAIGAMAMFWRSHSDQKIDPKS